MTTPSKSRGLNSSPFHAFLDFLDDFCGGNEVQDAESCHLVAHVFERGPEVIHLVVDEQKAVVNRAHCLRF